MCGIAGYWLYRQPARLQTVAAMCAQIRHRGPDDEGFHLDGGVALGMRRLSIIDLETGHQPIPNEDETLWIVFNGEIYQYRELRSELIAKGHRFRTQSDTETILHLYEEEGVDSLRHLRGMFAFAIWDSRRRTLLLARDRFGKKPLYYASLPEGFFFGSELKSLRTAGVPLDLDEEALRLYFQFQYVPDPLTPFRSMRKLPPGGWLLASGTGEIRQGRYWKLPAPAEHPAPGQAPETAIGRLKELFDEAVRIRMIADVPLGAFLSGGLDSGSVVASMARQSQEPVRTFTIGFEESGFNELPAARLVARQYGTEHHEIVVQPDAVDLVTRLVRHLDEPFGDSSAIPTFVVSEFAARHVKVVLTGDGGDELFGGYSTLSAIERRRIYDAVPQALRKFISYIADRLPYSAYGKNYLRAISRPTALDRYVESEYAFWFLRKQMLAPEWMLPAESGYLWRVFDDSLLPEGADVFSQAMYFEATAKLSGDILVKVDRMSMANSLEVRCPLLDQLLAEFAATLPHAWKLHDGRGKDIFVRALGDRLPPDLLALPKKGFGVPLAAWFRGPLHDYLWDHLTSVNFLTRGLVSPSFVRNMLEEHQTGRRDNNHWLWALLMLELWFRDLESPPMPVESIGGSCRETQV